MEKETKYFKKRGNGYVLFYTVAMDNTTRFDFFEDRKSAEEYALNELADKEYIGLGGIFRVEDYSEWIF